MEQAALHPQQDPQGQLKRRRPDDECEPAPRYKCARTEESELPTLANGSLNGVPGSILLDHVMKHLSVKTILLMTGVCDEWRMLR